MRFSYSEDESGPIDGGIDWFGFGPRFRRREAIGTIASYYKERH